MSRPSRPKTKSLPQGLVIIYEDRDIIVVDKPPGLLTMGTDKEKSRTAYFILTDYVRKGCASSRKRIFIVHRLDRDTSGILVFAKSEEAKFRLQGQWEETKKKYLAVVHGRFRTARRLSLPTWQRTKLIACTVHPMPQKENCLILPTRCSRRQKTLLCWKLIC